MITDRNTECGGTVPPVQEIVAKRFFHLVTDSESESCTEEIHVPRRRPSRLVLVSQNAPVTEAAMEQDLGDPPDSHE